MNSYTAISSIFLVNTKRLRMKRSLGRLDIGSYKTLFAENEVDASRLHLIDWNTNDQYEGYFHLLVARYHCRMQVPYDGLPFGYLFPYDGSTSRYGSLHARSKLLCLG